MNEAQTRYDYIDPQLKSKGWDSMNSRVITEHSISEGRIEITGRRAKPINADYVLEYQSKKLAVIEAKKSGLSMTEGLEQAKQYGKLLDIDFVYSTNGTEIYEFSLKTGKGKQVSEYPTPQELWDKTFSDHGKWKQIFVKTPFAKSGGRTPRYYQENAVNRALDAVAEGKKRILLTLATGTGKTYISSQFAYKLFESKWNLQGDQNRRPRILFLADRNILASQALNDFNVFAEDAKIRISPSELMKRDYQVPMNGNIFFTIFQTLVGDRGDERFFEKYPADFFDLVIIDECHRGGANDESSWREILDYFDPAVQLGLTATPKRKDNTDTYAYFGEPVYQYSLKEGINDGFLTPFRVKKIQTKLDEYVWSPEDEIEGDIDKNKVYEEKDFNVSIEIEERERQRVRIMFENMNKDEKTIVFCANQKHALLVRDLINEYKESNNPDYCVRVTANDGARGETYLKQFQDNENLIPTILTTSQKLSTGVDARNVRNIVLMRPVNSMIEFKQIVGRGTRVFEGKNYFTIIDFVKAYQHFADPEWDGEPEDQTSIIEGGTGEGGEVTSCKKCESNPCVCQKEPCDECGEYNCTCKKRTTAKIRLGKNDIELQYLIDTSFYGADGMPITSEQFLKNLFGRLPEFFKDENELRRIWSNPDTRAIFLNSLHEIGYDEAQLEEFKKVINAENSDLFDVFEYISFAIRPVSREERIEKALEISSEKFDQNTQDFLKFVLESYKKDGYKSLSSDKISTFLELKFGGLHEAQEKMGSIEGIRNSFYSIQEILYS